MPWSAVAAPAPLSPTCSAGGYAYAGLIGAMPVTAIASTVTSAVAPRVGIGHVAGWVGVGGPKEGPGGTHEWLQSD